MSDPQKTNTTEAPATGSSPAEHAPPRYSKRLKGMQKAERRLTNAQTRMANAVLAGLETWNKNRDKAAGNKKDGAVRKALDNYTRAYSKMVRESSRVPRDVIRGVLELYPRNVRKFWGF